MSPRRARSARPARRTAELNGPAELHVARSVRSLFRGALKRPTGGDCMNRTSLVGSFGLVAGLAAAVSAQAPSSNGKVDQKAVPSIRVKVIGCVAGDVTAGRYTLTGAFLSGDDTPPSVGTAGKRGSGKDLSFEN